MNIYIIDTSEGRICLNSTCEENDRILEDQGAIKLTEEQVEWYGMKGFEQYVSPLTTTVHDDGTVEFTPPTLESLAQEKFSSLRSERNMRLQASDIYVLPDFPISEVKRAQVIEYRQKLRDLLAQDGAPWDGGGEDTPWPVFNLNE